MGFKKKQRISAASCKPCGSPASRLEESSWEKTKHAGVHGVHGIHWWQQKAAGRIQLNAKENHISEHREEILSSRLFHAII